MIKLKLIALALALVLSAALTARAGGMTDALFSDTASGTISGTIGSWSPPPCTLEAGSSKARHWDLKEEQSPRVLPIAQSGAEGQLYLDFGDESPGNANSSPDTFRIVSHDAVARGLSFVVTGAVSGMISQVELKQAAVLDAGATESVRVKLSVPKDALPGEYAGELIVWVEGTGELRIPVVLTVKARGGGGEPEPQSTATPDAPTPVATPEGTPSDTPAPEPSPDAPADSTPAPTPLSTPTDTPSSASS